MVIKWAFLAYHMTTQFQGGSRIKLFGSLAISFARIPAMGILFWRIDTIAFIEVDWTIIRTDRSPPLNMRLRPLIIFFPGLFIGTFSISFSRKIFRQSAPLRESLWESRDKAPIPSGTKTAALRLTRLRGLTSKSFVLIQSRVRCYSGHDTLHGADFFAISYFTN